MNDELGYLSSTNNSSVQPEVNLRDEQDLPTLQQIHEYIVNTIPSYDSIESLTLDETTLTVKEQLAVNKSVKMHLENVKMTIEATMENIKEKYSGRR